MYALANLHLPLFHICQPSKSLQSSSVVVARFRLLSQSPGTANGHHPFPCKVQGGSRWRGGLLLTTLRDTKSDQQPLKVQQTTTEGFISKQLS